MSDQPSHLPDDLQDLGEALRAHREVVDGRLLDRVLRRIQPARPKSPRWQRLRPRRPRTIAALVLAVGLGLNVSGAMATVLTDCGLGSASASSLNVTQIISSIGHSTSTGSDYESAAGNVYCNTEGKTWSSITTNGTMNGGTGGSGSGDSDDCCPTGTTPYNGTMDGGSGGSGSGGSQACCSSSSGSQYNGTMQGGSGGSGGSQACCSSSSDSQYNGTMQGGSGGWQTCCPSSSTSQYNGTMNGATGGSQSGCCPGGYQSQVQSQDEWNAIGSQVTSTACCPSSSGSQYNGTMQGGSGGSGSGGSQNGCCPFSSSSSGQTYSQTSGTNQKGCCPKGTQVSLKWHYSVNGSQGNWSGSSSSTGSWSTGYQALEGSQKVMPGATLEVGYQVSVANNAQPLSFFVNKPTATFAVKCVSGKAPSSSILAVSLPTQEYRMSDSEWYQGSANGYQASTSVPNLCNGGQMSLNQGGSFAGSWS